MKQRKRYAVVGLGGRSLLYVDAVAGKFRESAELVGFCDINKARMQFHNGLLVKNLGHPAVPVYTPDQFEKMIQETRPDSVIVTCIDRLHDHYIIQAMELGCDAITEKPMTTDAEKCRRIMETVKRTGRNLRVTFNYRYAPRFTRVKELIREGAIGEVKSVHFEWLLDTSHGADYFRRWHRDKRNSGGLLVHKATHHFDLVNWWTNSRPESVFCFADLDFYGRENAEKRGVVKFYDRGTGHPNAVGDPFALDLNRDGVDSHLRKLYLDAEGEDGYRRDQSVFSDGISIEDDMSVLVKYNTGMKMTYHLTAYSPWEGLRIAFNGSKGRLEYTSEDNSYVSGDNQDPNRPYVRDAGVPDPKAGRTELLVRPLWAPPYPVELPDDSGGHGGGDLRLLQHVFAGVEEDPLGHAADHRQGAWSILTGIAGNTSMRTGQPVRISDIIDPSLLE